MSSLTMRPMFPTQCAIQGASNRGQLPLPATPTHSDSATRVGGAHSAPPVPRLLLPFAVLTQTEGGSTLPEQPLPTLTQLLALTTDVSHQAHAPAGTDARRSLTPPHEWALATALGLAPLPSPTDPSSTPWPDGQIPWAAWAYPQHLATPDAPAAWFTPCHQEVGTGQVTLYPPDTLALSDAHSQALMAALQPLAAEDGITLTWVAADRWLAQGPVFAGLATASLDRVAGRSIGPWLSTGTAAAGLRRLQSEAQMLFYTHPAHDKRQAQHLAPINAFWISGSGACPAHARRHAPECAVDTSLRTAALRQDAVAWQQAWRALDADVLPAWLAHAQQGHAMDLTLCGERTSVTLHLRPTSGWQGLAHKISSIFRPLRLSNITSSL